MIWSLSAYLNRERVERFVDMTDVPDPKNFQNALSALLWYFGCRPDDFATLYASEALRRSFLDHGRWYDEQMTAGTYEETQRKRREILEQKLKEVLDQPMERLIETLTILQRKPLNAELGNFIEIWSGGVLRGIVRGANEDEFGLQSVSLPLLDEITREIEQRARSSSGYSSQLWRCPLGLPLFWKGSQVMASE